MKLALLALLVTTSAFAQVSTQSQDMPPCLSTCMTPFPGSHEPDTCTANWMSTISSCIDRACSTSVSTEPDNGVRTTLFFSPKKEYSCQQSLVPGADQTSSSLQLQPGVCALSPYAFRSFLVNYGQNGVMQDDCTLHLFDAVDCSGQARNVSLAGAQAMSGMCQFSGGRSVMLACGNGTEGGVSDNQAAHSYLSSICSQGTHTSSSTTGTVTASITTLTPVPVVTSGNSTFTLSTPAAMSMTTSVWTNSSSDPTDDPPVYTNATLRSSSLVIPTVSVSGPVGDSSESDKVVKRNGAAQWALVIVVFARSLMY